MKRLLNNPAVWGIGAVLIFIVGFFLIRDWKNRIAREALLKEQLKATTTALLSAEDSMARVRAKTDTIVQIVNRVVPDYSRQRERVDTLEVVDTLRVDSIPPNHVVVPIEFVRAADSLKITLVQLEAQVRVDRIATDSVINLFRTENQALRDLNRVQRGGGTLNALKWMGVGGGVVALAVAVLK